MLEIKFKWNFGENGTILTFQIELENVVRKMVAILSQLQYCGLVTPHGDRFESILVQVMACCLMAPSHYLNQCSFVIVEVQWHLSDSNFARDTSVTSHNIHLNITLKKDKIKRTNNNNNWKSISRSCFFTCLTLRQHFQGFFFSGLSYDTMPECGTSSTLQNVLAQICCKLPMGPMQGQ